jgi:uncharacterized secreted protein with C-terminal beta-propeller domain
MVTFRSVDPLFVFNLANPAAPVMTGYLKIPGYSDYLHPYDDTHLIGFGKDTVEINGQPYYLGIKMSMFDVTDIANPLESYKVIIGDRGSQSELLQNHKALLFSREKNIIAFPVSLHVVASDNKTPAVGSPPYGQFQVQGLYVYGYSAAGGFVYRGTVSHYPYGGNTGGPYIQQPGRDIVRSLYIGDVLYTLSTEYVVASSLADLKEINSLKVR